MGKLAYTKRVLRKIFREKRRKLSPDFIAASSLDIARNCLRLNLEHVKTVHLYLSSAKLREVNTRLLIRFLFERKKELLVPRLTPERMEQVVYWPGTALREDYGGMAAPSRGRAMWEKQPDAVFVPLLAYDEMGHRVGYGKGYYDKFLLACKPGVYKIGLSFFAPVAKIIDVMSTDIALTHCVTPNRIYDFGN